MEELTVGDIRPLLTLAANNPIFNDTDSIASQIRALIEGLGVPLTPELQTTLNLIETNPILIDAGIAEFRSAIEGLPDDTLLSSLSGFGDGSSGEVETVTQDMNGNDIQTFTLPYSGTTIAVDGDEVTVSIPGQTPQVLVGLDRLEFTDGTFFLDVEDGAGLVKTAYQALLDRDAPDASGFDFWLDLYEAGTIDTFALTENFTQSAAFSDKYGAILSDFDTLIEAFYQNIFGRAADDLGKTFWTGFLESSGGTDAVDETLAYILESDEFSALVGTSYSDGIFV